MHATSSVRARVMGKTLPFACLYPQAPTTNRLVLKSSNLGQIKLRKGCGKAWDESKVNRALHHSIHTYERTVNACAVRAACVPGPLSCVMGETQLPFASLCLPVSSDSRTLRSSQALSRAKARKWKAWDGNRVRSPRDCIRMSVRGSSQANVGRRQRRGKYGMGAEALDVRSIRVTIGQKWPLSLHMYVHEGTKVHSGACTYMHGATSGYLHVPAYTVKGQSLYM